MAKSKAKKNLSKPRGSNKPRMLKFWIGIIVLLLLSFIGFRVYNTYPQASFSQISNLSNTYNEALSSLKSTLADKYQECSTNKDLDGWKTFSQDWISKIGKASPPEFGLRLSNRSMELVNASNFMSRDLFQLWTEYNVAIESATPVDPLKEKALLDSLEAGHQFILNRTSK